MNKNQLFPTVIKDGALPRKTFSMGHAADKRFYIEARKITQIAANSGRYKVEIPVNANTLGATAKRMLWAGAAVGAISALIEGVGWVIDHGSQVIKKPKLDPH